MALITPIYMMIQEAGLIGTKTGIIFVHAAKALPFTVLILSVFFQDAEGAVRGGDHRRLLRFQPSAAGGADGAAVDWRDRPVRLHALLCRVHVRDGPVGRRRDPAGLGGDGGAGAQPGRSWSLLNAGIFIAILPTLIWSSLVWRFVIEDL